MVLWSKQAKPRPGSPWKMFGALNAYAAAIAVFNAIFNTNYMYLCSKPAGASTIDFLGPWPVYLLGCEALRWQSSACGHAIGPRRERLRKAGSRAVCAARVLIVCIQSTSPSRVIQPLPTSSLIRSRGMRAFHARALITARAHSQKAAAHDAICHLRGVTGVADKIALRPASVRNAVKAHIESALARHFGKRLEYITIETRGDHVILRGTYGGFAFRTL
jgi:hypothetical protein